ncbi:MAG: Kef-type K+ transport system membrane component KefB, partial [Arcticibacterium sp.]
QDTNMSIGSVAQVASISILKLSAFIALLAFSYYAVKKITKSENFVDHTLNKFLSFIKGKESLFALFFAFILLFSSITEALGFHFIIGAFFAAMLLNESILGTDNLKNIEKTTSSLAMGFLAPIFFASIGLEFSISSIHNIELLVAVVSVSYLSKIIGGYLGSYFAGLSHKVSLVMGFGLNARGIMELVIAKIAFKAELINHEMFSILVIMGVLTTITTPIMLKWGFKKLE